MTTETVKSGASADIYSPFTPFSPAHRARLQDQMQGFYENFVEKVAESRKTTPEKIDAVAQGRVWTGRQAREHGWWTPSAGSTSPCESRRSAPTFQPTRTCSW